MYRCIPVNSCHSEERKGKEVGKKEVMEGVEGGGGREGGEGGRKKEGHTHTHTHTHAYMYQQKL